MPVASWRLKRNSRIKAIKPEKDRREKECLVGWLPTFSGNLSTESSIQIRVNFLPLFIVTIIVIGAMTERGATSRRVEPTKNVRIIRRAGDLGNKFACGFRERDHVNRGGEGGRRGEGADAMSRGNHVDRGKKIACLRELTTRIGGKR